MTDREVHSLLAELVDQDPPVDIDVDLQLTRGRRRAQRRTALVVVAALALPIAGIGGTYAVTHRQAEPVVLGSPGLDLPGQPVAKAPTFPWGLPDGMDLPSETESPQSKQLARQLKALTPELKKYPQVKVHQFGWYDNSGLSPRHSAAASHLLGGGGELSVWHVEVSDRKAGHGTPWVCESEYEKDDPCDAIRKLPDGSYAFVKSIADASAVEHGVRVVRPNGTQIYINSTVRFPYKNFTKPVLSPKRLIEIASKITVKP